MPLIGEHTLLRVYLQMADRPPHAPTYERILRVAHNTGLSGATVLKGFMGFGGRGVLRASRWRWVKHVPVIVELIDSGKRIGEFVNGPLGELLSAIGGLATLEQSSVILYRHRSAAHNQAVDPRMPRQSIRLVSLVEPRSAMQITDNGVLLRVFIGESDRFEQQPLYEAIVDRARGLGLAGATVLRGLAGFGAHGAVHKAKLLESSADLPVVIEIVDAPSRIDLFLPHLQGMIHEGLITMEPVCILNYRPEPRADRPLMPRADDSS